MFHYAVYIAHYNRPTEAVLFEREADAMKHAKFMTHNCRNLHVIQLDQPNSCYGVTIASSVEKRKLKKIPARPAIG